MATKKTPTKTDPKKKVAPAKKKSVAPKSVAATPATEKALKKVSKRMTKFVTEIANNKEQVELYFAGINEFISGYKEEIKKPVE